MTAPTITKTEGGAVWTLALPHDPTIWARVSQKRERSFRGNLLIRWVYRDFQGTIFTVETRTAGIDRAIRFLRRYDDEIALPDAPTPDATIACKGDR